MAIGGFAWLADLSIQLTDHLSPHNVISGFIMSQASGDTADWNVRAVAQAKEEIPVCT